MRALPMLLLTLMLADWASAFEPQVHIILPETISNNLSRSTTLRPEIEITNNGETPVIYHVEGTENRRTIWKSALSFSLRDSSGTEIRFYLPLNHGFPRKLTLPAGASIRLHSSYSINAPLRLAGTYTLSGSLILEDKQGTRHKIIARPASFILEPSETSSIPQLGGGPQSASAISAH